MENSSIYKSNIPMIILGFSALLSFLELISNSFDISSSLTNLFIGQVLVIFIISFVNTCKRIGILHIFTLLHITTFVFAFGSLLVFVLLGMDGFKVAYSPTYVRFHEETVQRALCLYSLFISISYVSFFHFYKKNKYNPQLNSIPKIDKKMFKIGRVTMLLMFPFAILSSYTLFQIGFENRGALYLSGSMSELGMPFYLRITNMFFTTGFYVLIASVPKQKNFLKYFGLYAITLIPVLMMGERGEVIIPFIFLLWYLFRVYGTKINLGLLLGIGIVTMLISFIVSVVRLGDSISGLSFSDMIIGFFGTSATSLELLQYYIEFKKTIGPHNYPFVLDSLIGGLTGAYGQSEETLQIRASLGHHLVYALNPKYYFSGFSTGTSYIAECYEFGAIGVGLGAIVLGWFCNVFNAYIMKSHFRMLFLYLCFQLIILSPRGSLFLGLYDIIKYSLCYMILKFSIGLIINKIKK